MDIIKRIHKMYYEVDSSVHEQICQDSMKELQSLLQRNKELEAENTQAFDYAKSLAECLWRNNYKDVSPDFELFDNLNLILTQIDNMTVGLKVPADNNQGIKALLRGRNEQQQLIDDLEQQILSQQLTIEKMREALESSFNNIEKFKNKWLQTPAFGDKVNKTIRQSIGEAHSYIFLALNDIQEALSLQPSTAELAEHDEAIRVEEREVCSGICDKQAIEWDSDDLITNKNYAGYCAEAIRQRKTNE